MKCVVCRKDNWSKKYKTLLKCGGCGFVRANDKFFKIDPKKIYSRQYFNGDDYFDYESEENALKVNFRNRLNRILKYRKNGKLLEIGCAYGYFLELASNNFKTYGIDLDKETTRIAKKNSKSKIYTGDLIKTNVGKNYDIICMFDVIEHLKYPDLYFKKIYKILKPNGVVVIETGDIGSTLAKIQKEKWRLIKPPFHLQYFDRKTLHQFLSKNKLEVKLSEHTSFERTLSQTIYRLHPSPVTNKISEYIPKFSFSINTNDILFVIAQKTISN